MPDFRCPTCRAALTVTEDEHHCGACGARFARLAGVPVLMPDADLAAIDLRTTGNALPTYDSASMGISWINEALARGDQVLELGAGLDINQSPNVVRTDAFVYGSDHLHAVADAHRLPFADGSFDFVFSLAVFEHLHSPWLAAREIARVLRPGGGAYTLCAFMQPLHGYPDHYFNATESGLARLFADDFDIQVAGPSRHCPHDQTLVQTYLMRNMAIELLQDRSVPRATRARALALKLSLSRSAREFNRLAEVMIRRPAAYGDWRKIAPAVEVYAVRT